MKKHNDDWEEFLKQREKEKHNEDMQLEELLKHDHPNNYSNQNKNDTKSSNLNTSIDYNYKSGKAKLPDIEKLAVPDFDVDSLSEQEILGGITSCEEADKIYEETYAEYEKAYEAWEADPDNADLQRKLDIATSINDIATKRLDILQDKDIDEKANKIKEKLSILNNTNKVNKKTTLPNIQNLSDPDFDIDSLTKQEILGDVTSYAEADRLYQESYKKYKEAFKEWEANQDNDELQKKLDIASNINDLAQKRLSIFQEMELNDLKQNRLAFEQSISSNSANKRKTKSKILPFVILFASISSFFAMIFLATNGHPMVGKAVFPCTMVLIVFVCIYKFFISPQFEALKNKSSTNTKTNDDTNTPNTPKPKSLAVAKFKVLSILFILAGFLFLTIFGGALGNLVMIFTGVGGFVGSIILLATISKIKSKSSQTALPTTGTVKSCKEEVQDNEQGYLENVFKVVIEANGNYYTCFSKNEYSVGSTITIYINPNNKKKVYIKE